MKYLPIEYISIKNITHTQLNSKITTNTTNNVYEALSVLSPEKAELRKKKKSEHISVIMYPDIPFGPDPVLIAGKTFENFEESLKTAAAYYDIKMMEIFGWKSEFSMDNGRIHFRRKRFPSKGDTVEITMLELVSLLAAAEGKDLKRLVSVSFLPDISSSRSFITTPPVDINHLASDFSDLNKLIESKENTFSDPLSGKILDFRNNPEIKFERDTMVLINTGGNKGIFKANGFLCFPFPYFRRKISYRKGVWDTHKTAPCINCMACSGYCPSRLNPSYIYHLLISGNPEKAFSLNMDSCILCGKCSFVCPSYIPISQTIEEKMHELEEIS